MADIDVRESFPTLEDANKVGKPLHEAVNGATDPSGLSGLIGFSFKDSTGKIILPQLDSSGRIAVTMAGPGTDKKAYAKVAGSLSVVPVVSLSLTAAKTHREIECIVACLREAQWEVVAIDDPTGTPTEVILTEFLTGPGQYSFHWEMSEMSFVSGATTPILRVRAKNLEKASDMRATLCALEVA